MTDFTVSEDEKRRQKIINDRNWPTARGLPRAEVVPYVVCAYRNIQDTSRFGVDMIKNKHVAEYGFDADEHIHEYRTLFQALTTVTEHSELRVCLQRLSFLYKLRWVLMQQRRLEPKYAAVDPTYALNLSSDESENITEMNSDILHNAYHFLLKFIERVRVEYMVKQMRAMRITHALNPIGNGAYLYDRYIVAQETTQPLTRYYPIDTPVVETYHAPEEAVQRCTFFKWNMFERDMQTNEPSLRVNWTFIAPVHRNTFHVDMSTYWYSGPEEGDFDVFHFFASLADAMDLEKYTKSHELHQLRSTPVVDIVHDISKNMFDTYKVKYMEHVVNYVQLSAPRVKKGWTHYKASKAAWKKKQMEELEKQFGATSVPQAPPAAQPAQPVNSECTLPLGASFSATTQEIKYKNNIKRLERTGRLVYMATYRSTITMSVMFGPLVIPYTATFYCTDQSIPYSRKNDIGTDWIRDLSDVLYKFMPRRYFVDIEYFCSGKHVCHTIEAFSDCKEDCSNMYPFAFEMDDMAHYDDRRRNKHNVFERAYTQYQVRSVAPTYAIRHNHMGRLTEKDMMLETLEVYRSIMVHRLKTLDDAAIRNGYVRLPFLPQLCESKEPVEGWTDTVEERLQKLFKEADMPTDPFLDSRMNAVHVSNGNTLGVYMVKVCVLGAPTTLGHRADEVHVTKDILPGDFKELIKPYERLRLDNATGEQYIFGVVRRTPYIPRALYERMHILLDRMNRKKNQPRHVNSDNTPFPTDTASFATPYFFKSNGTDERTHEQKMEYNLFTAFRSSEYEDCCAEPKAAEPVLTEEQKRIQQEQENACDDEDDPEHIQENAQERADDMPLFDEDLRFPFPYDTMNPETQVELYDKRRELFETFWRRLEPESRDKWISNVKRTFYKVIKQKKIYEEYMEFTLKDITHQEYRMVDTYTCLFRETNTEKRKVFNTYYDTQKNELKALHMKYTMEFFMTYLILRYRNPACNCIQRFIHVNTTKLSQTYLAYL
jgi:hypothetical protein